MEYGKFIIVNGSKGSGLLSLSPLYPICIYGNNTLTDNQKHVDIKGIIDYKCLDKQNLFLESQSNIISNNSHYAIQILFTLLIFLFGFGKNRKLSI